MKRFAVLSALLLFSSVSHAQNAPSDSAKNAVPSAGTDDARMKPLRNKFARSPEKLRSSAAS